MRHSLLFAAQHRPVRQAGGKMAHMRFGPQELTLAPRNWNERHGRAEPGGRPRRERFRKGANPMYSNIVVVFNFILSQWSLTPQAFKEAVLAAALAKCVLAVIWWTTRMLVAKFPANATLSACQKLLDTRPAKLVVLILYITTT